jgi:hypothetical protein
MLLSPQGPGSIPEETVRVARAICPKGTFICRSGTTSAKSMRTSPSLLYFPHVWQPAEVQWRLVCIFQFIEGLADAIEPRSHHHCPLSDHRG